MSLGNIILPALLLLPRKEGDGVLLSGVLLTGVLLSGVLLSGDGVLLRPVVPVVVNLGVAPNRSRRAKTDRGVIIVGSTYESLLGCFVP